MWNPTSPLQRESSGKEEAEASLRAGSCIAGEPASLTQAPQLWSKQGHHRWKGEAGGGQELCVHVLSLLGAPEAAGRELQRPSPTWEVDQEPGSPRPRSPRTDSTPPTLSSPPLWRRLPAGSSWKGACPLRRRGAGRSSGSAATPSLCPRVWGRDSSVFR